MTVETTKGDTAVCEGMKVLTDRKSLMIQDPDGNQSSLVDFDDLALISHGGHLYLATGDDIEDEGVILSGLTVYRLLAMPAEVVDADFDTADEDDEDDNNDASDDSDDAENDEDADDEDNDSDDDE